LASFDIGAKLKQERVGQGLALDEIARTTRIPGRFLEAIEADEFSRIPGLIFTRNFVRQYALALKLDPDPLLAELPKQDEATVQLPNPPARPRSSYHRDRAMRSLATSLAWIALAGGAGYGAYVHFNHTLRSTTADSAVANAASPAPAGSQADSDTVVTAPPAITAPVVAGDSEAAVPDAPALNTPAAVSAQPALAVQVSMTAHEAAWVQITADGKPAFTGTLHSNETKQFAAAEQVGILTGNAGGLTISLNGKTLDPLGPSGQIRSVRLTVEGPQFLSKAPQLVFDPLDPL
jgi:cytoskeletal protein RodZ